MSNLIDLENNDTNNNNSNSNNNNNSNMNNNTITNRSRGSGAGNAGNSSSNNNSNNNNNNNDDDDRGDVRHGGSSLSSLMITLRRWLNIFSIILNTILLPIDRITKLIFPIGEFDGLSAPITAKASEQFVNYLKRLQLEKEREEGGAQQLQEEQREDDSNNDQNSSTSSISCWNTLGFETVVQNAAGNNTATNIARADDNAAARVPPMKHNQLILIYLHSPYHSESDWFCKNVLLSNEMQSFLSKNAAATTSTPPTGNDKKYLTCFGVSIHTAQGLDLSQMLNVCSYPFLCLLQPKSISSSSSNSNNRRGTISSNTPTNTFQLMFKAEGSILCCKNTASETAPSTSAASSSTSSSTTNSIVVVNTLISWINQILTRHEVLLAEQEAKHIQRIQEIELRKQQDHEYQESLRIDRERELAKEQKRKELEELEKAKQLEMEKEQNFYSDAKKFLISCGYYDGSVENDNDKPGLILSSPYSNNKDPSLKISRLRFVLPYTGAKLDYHFNSNKDTIKTLKSFLLIYFYENCSNNEDLKNIKRIGLSTNFPKQSFNDEDDDNDTSNDDNEDKKPKAKQQEKTLHELGLFPQAVLMVQNLDA